MSPCAAASVTVSAIAFHLDRAAAPCLQVNGSLFHSALEKRPVSRDQVASALSDRWNAAIARACVRFLMARFQLPSTGFCCSFSNTNCPSKLEVLMVVS
jgi:hypothetical protein